MSLNHRQRAAYTHRCDIWQPGRSIGTGGRPGPESWVCTARAAPCLYIYMNNLSDPVPGAGRVRRTTILRVDHIHFDAAQSIGDGWIVKNVSLLADGSPSPLSGQFHRVLSEAKVVIESGRRRANARIVLAEPLERAPAEVV
jgi:hypothetical protein